MRVLMILAVLLVVPAIGDSATIHVPKDYPKIQTAIDVAKAWDHIEVAPGTYVENIDFLGKTITVKSASGSAVTVIDGNQAGSVVTFQNGEGPNSRLEGFTITNGTGTLGSTWSVYVGGGIYVINGSDPTITQNTITGNSLTSAPYCFGGGVFCGFSSPLISDNTISNNHVNGSGAGLFMERASPTIEKNAITDNTADQSGGGIQVCWDSAPTIANNDISLNTVSQYSGGGMYVAINCAGTIEKNTISKNQAFHGAGIFFAENLGVTLLGNTITENHCDTYGGGIYCIDDSPLIKGNTIAQNTADYGGGGMIVTFAAYGSDPDVRGNLIMQNGCTSDSGGGIYIFQSSGDYTNNVICMNSAGAGGGGGIACISYATPVLTNNTVYGNEASAYAGGITVDYYASAEITNGIGWDNEVSGWGAPEIRVGNNATLTISHSDVEGGKSKVKVAGTGTLNWGPGMIDADPVVEDGLGGDLHLTWTSPCINRGLNAGAPYDDMDGEWRPYMGTVDMGADEFFGIHPLEASAFSIPINPGGKIQFGLTGKSANAGRTYLLLSSVTGHAPGAPLPGGQATLAVNWDLFTNLTLSLLNSSVFAKFMGTLDGSGYATATFDTQGPLPPEAMGITFSFAYALNSPFDFASNPINVLVQ